MKLLKETTYVKYVLENYQNLSKPAHKPPQTQFYRGCFEN